MWLVFVALGDPGDLGFSFEAKGRAETVFELPDFGRYAFEVKSEVGTTLQVVDRMEGPGPRVGTLGEEDGRFDGFFERGQVKVRLAAPGDGRGNAVVTATPFEKIGTDEALTKGRPELTDLEDKQSRAWWIEIPNEPVQIEAVGRYLADLRFWRDGSWLVDATPRCGRIEPVDGQPLQRCILNTALEPGLYRVVAYGGQGEPWAEDAADSLFTLRWDAPVLPEAGVRTGRIGPTGTEVFRVPGRADSAHLTLPDIAPAGISLTGAGNTNLFGNQPSASITDESRIPETTARSSGSANQVLTVSGTPGQRYEVRWFRASTSAKIGNTGKTLITSVSTARPSDTLPPSALFYRKLAQGQKVLSNAAGLELKSGTQFEKRFNLMSSTSVFVELDEEMHVRLEVTEGKANVLFERVFLTPPKDYKRPEVRSQIWNDKHPAGTYRLTLHPQEPGIVTLVAASNNWGDVVASGTPITMRPGLREVLDLDPGAPVHILATEPPGSRTGLIVRDLPLDVREAVPLPLAPGERFVLPVKTATATKMRAVLPSGELLPLELLGTTATEIDLPRGSFALTVHNPSDQPVVAVLGEIPVPDPPARIPTSRLGELPTFDKLSFAEAAFLDLDRNRSRTLQLDVAEDGLYALRSTGLLATSAKLRSRVRLKLGDAKQNGSGRNFQLDRYLRSGTYQVTVSTLGSTRGHLGVELAASPLRDEGDLVDGRIARATAAAGEGLRYRFTVKDRASATVRSRSPERNFGCRLEDEDGWPVVSPRNSCDFSTTLDPGTYVIVSLPADVDTKRHTSFTLDQIGETLEGHGPHPLSLASTSRHTWVEPPGKGDRPVDLWDFTLPADLKVEIDTGEEMAGALTRDGQVLQRLAPGRTWTGPLEKGDYQLQLRAARRGTGVRYGVRVGVDELTVGQTRSVNLPAKLPLVVGTAGMVAISSNGDADVRARLIDPEGVVVEANDDRPDDWNFRIGRYLKPGRWTLELSSLGNRRRTTITAAAPDEVVGRALATGKATPIPVQETTSVHPIGVSGRNPLLVDFDAPQNLSIAVEQENDGIWESLGSVSGKQGALLARHSGGRDLRLRLASLDGRPGTVNLGMKTLKPKSPSEETAAAGVRFGKKPWGAIDGKNLPPGLYRVASDRSELVLCRESGQSCSPAQSVVSMDKSTVLFGRGVRLVRADLANEPVPVELSRTPTRLQTGLKGLIALEVRSVSTKAGASISNGASALSDDAAIALGKGTATVWGEGVGRIRAVELSSSDLDWDGMSALPLEIPAGTAFRISMNAGLRHPISLDTGLVASSGDAMLWADRNAVRGFLSTDNHLLLANPTGRTALAVVEPAVTVSDAPEHFAAAAAVQVHEIPASEGLLHARGAKLTYLRRDGAVLRGTGLEVGAGGMAWVEHGLGWHTLWSDAEGPGPWDEADAIESALVFGVTRIEASGPYAVRIDESRVEWKPDGTPTEVLSNGGSLEIRGLGGQPLETSTRTLPVDTLTEGLGPEVLLDGSGPRWFRFAIAEAGPIGFGVRASADRVVATLIAADGTEVASGVVGMKEVEAGVWYLRLSQPPDAAPVRARPALTGIDRPDTGPPEDVVKTYLNNARVGGNP